MTLIGTGTGGLTGNEFLQKLVELQNFNKKRQATYNAGPRTGRWNVRDDAIPREDAAQDDVNHNKEDDLPAFVNPSVNAGSPQYQYSSVTKQVPGVAVPGQSMNTFPGVNFGANQGGGGGGGSQMPYDLMILMEKERMKQQGENPPFSNLDQLTINQNNRQQVIDLINSIVGSITGMFGNGLGGLGGLFGGGGFNFNVNQDGQRVGGGSIGRQQPQAPAPQQDWPYPFPKPNRLA